MDVVGEPPRYLAVSTVNGPSVETVGVYTGDPPSRQDDREPTACVPTDADVGKWSGEA